MKPAWVYRWKRRIGLVAHFPLRWKMNSMLRDSYRRLVTDFGDYMNMWSEVEARKISKPHTDLLLEWHSEGLITLSEEQLNVVLFYKTNDNFTKIKILREIGQL